MKIRKHQIHFFILLFAASSLLFQLPPEAFASTPSDITATDSETDGVNSFDALRDPKAVSTFVIGSSTYAIVASNDGVQIIDISDPTAIVAKDNVDDGDTDSNGNTFTELDGPSSVDTFVIGSSTYAIIGDVSNGDVQIIDISDPTDILATDTATDIVQSGDDPGFVGFECAVAFNDFVKNYDLQISAEDVIDRYKEFSATMNSIQKDVYVIIDIKLNFHP